MQKTPARKYQVVEEAEIDLVLKCRDSHEFYEQYLRYSRIQRKVLTVSARSGNAGASLQRNGLRPSRRQKPGQTNSREIQTLIAEQTKIMIDMAALTKENLEVSRQILSALAHQNRILTGRHEEKAKDPANPAPPPKPPVQKKAPEKQTPIMVGS